MSADVGTKEALKPIIVPSYSEEKEEKESFIDKIPFAKRKINKSTQTVEKKPNVLRKTPLILPFVDIAEDYIEMKNGYMDILQITPMDLHALNQHDTQLLLLAEARFYRSYFPNFKTIGLNFPSSTEKQRQYWQRKKEKTSDSLRLRFINRKIFELTFLEKERTNREFFIFIYAKTVQSLEEERNQVTRAKRQSFPLQKLSVEKKQDILFILNNQNTKL